MAIKLYRLLWTEEGKFWRRGDVIIRKPDVPKARFSIKRVYDTKTWYTYEEREAFNIGNKLARDDNRRKRKTGGNKAHVPGVV